MIVFVIMFAATLGISTGWTAVAIWVNLSTTLADLGAPITGTWGTAWQLLTVAAATGVVALIAFRISANRALLVAFAASSAWALEAAATIGAAPRSAPTPSVAAGLLTVVFAVTCLVALRRRAIATI